MANKPGDAAAEVLRADDERYRAMIANDLTALGRLLSDDLSYTHSTGRHESKAEYIGSLQAGRVKYVTAQRDAVTAKVYGDTAFLSGKIAVKAVVSGETKDLNSRFLNVWVRNAGAWQMVAWQSTPIQQK